MAHVRCRGLWFYSGITIEPQQNHNRNSMKNLFLFTGQETYLLTQQINYWKESFLQKHGDINLLTLDADEVSLGQIMTDVEAQPFLGDKRLIFIYGLPEKASTRETKKSEKRDEDLKKLASYLPKIPETSVVVFVQSEPDKRKSFYKMLAKQAEVKEFNPLKGIELGKWVTKQVNSLGGKIDKNTVDYLITTLGDDLWKLSNEIQKLASYTAGEPITILLVDHICIPTMEANIFKLTDGLGEKNHKKAIHHLHQMMAAGEDLRPVFYMVIRQFRLLLRVGDYLKKNPSVSSEAIASALKIHPFVAKNTLAQLRSFDFDELKKAYAELLEIDHRLKTSRIRVTNERQEELALVIEQFVLGFCS